MTMPNETTITLTVTEEEARKIVRALRARRNHWRSPDKINQENASAIARAYEALAGKVRAQYEKQK